MSTNNFAEACATYRLLREKGYPEKATLKLVGDRHRLSRMQRNCLFRGVIASATAARRRRRSSRPRRLPDSPSALTGTMFSSRWKAISRASVLFVADDGVVRDASGNSRQLPHRAAHRRARWTRSSTRSPVCGRPAWTRTWTCRSPSPALMAEELRARLARLAVPAEVSLAHERRLSTESLCRGSWPPRIPTSWTARARPRPRAAVLAARFGFTPPAVHDLFPGISRSTAAIARERNPRPASRRMAAPRDSPRTSRRAFRTSSS